MRRKIQAILLVLAGLTATGCERSRPTAPAEPRTAPPVGVWRVAPGRIAQRVEITGEIRPFSVVHLAPKVAGRLEWLAVEDDSGNRVPLAEGMNVRRGQVLGQIDRAVYEARLKQAEAALRLARVQFEDAAREKDRIKGLYEEGSATQQALDKATTARELAAAALAQAEAAHALARIEFDESQLKAPVDAVVVRKHVDEGNLVSVGMPVLTLEEQGRVKVVATISERHLPLIEPGRTRALVRCDARGDEAIEAVVTKVYPSVDPLTRTGTLEIELDNPDRRLVSGSFARVWVTLSEVDDAIVIPLSAVTWEGARGFVYVVEDGRVKRRDIKIGIREADRCQVLEGLSAGESLVVEGSRELREGDPIAVREVSL